MTKRTVTLDEAARIMGASKEALRKRIKRGTIDAKKDTNGRWLVTVDQDTGEDAVRDTSRTLVDVMQKEIEYLRQENERKDHIIMSLTQRVPLLRAREDKLEGKDKRPWWKRIFKGGDGPDR